jgi:ACR3 family arsenite efflux pump ArsB
MEEAQQPNGTFVGIDGGHNPSQIVAFAGLGWFYLVALPGWLGLQTSGLHDSVGLIAESVAIFLGIPLVAGFLTRTNGERTKGRAWYEERFLPKIGPIALYGLLFTIVVLFALQGREITGHPLDVVRIAAPLLCYFADHVERFLCARQSDRPSLRAYGNARVHRRRQ